MRKSSVEGGKLIRHGATDLYFCLALRAMSARFLVALGFSFFDSRGDVPISRLESSPGRSQLLGNPLY